MLPHVVAALVAVVATGLVICEAGNLWIKIILSCLIFLGVYVITLCVIDKSEIKVLRAMFNDLRRR